MTERREAIAKQDAKAYKWGCCCALPTLLVFLPLFVLGFIASQYSLGGNGDLGATLPRTDEQMQDLHYEEVRQYFNAHQSQFEALRKQVQEAAKKSDDVKFTWENNILVSRLGLQQASFVRIGLSKRVVLRAYAADRRLGYYSYVYSETESPFGEVAYRQLKPKWFMDQNYER